MLPKFRAGKSLQVFSFLVATALLVVSAGCNRSSGGRNSPPAGPAIVSITPSKGDVTKFTLVEIVTTGFADDFTVYSPAVTFDLSPATVVQVLSPSSIQVWSPPALTPATVDVTVQSSWVVEQATRPNGFEYVVVPSGACSILGVTPSVGPLWGGTDVTITGTGFTAGAQVFFDILPATNVIFDSSTQIRATTPGGISPTLVDVTVSDPGAGVSCTAPMAFQYVTVPPPLPCSITSLCPDQGDTAGGDVVVIQGMDFEATPQVSFGGVPSPSVTFVSIIEIWAETPAIVVGGAVDVFVDNPTPGSDCTAAGAFTYRITSPTPDAAKEPDDVMVDCNSVPINPVIMFSNIHSNTDEDWYCFGMLMAPDRTVTLDPDPVADPNLDLELYDSTGAFIASSTNPSGQDQLATPGQGNFLVRVIGVCGEVGDYELTFSDGS
ncbi:MAG: IPT/TIG domain-containing protein [Planctomycetota bacterium]|nr:IPT/TIG domain-containing protein [Planctomycetota bacterium]